MRDDLQDFFYNKRILVTGHVTYLGAWLCMLLSKMGAKLTGLSIQKPENPNLYEEADVHEIVHAYIDKANNTDVLDRINREFQPEIVIQLSSVCGYIENFDPKDIYTSNLLGTLNTLETSRQSNHVRVLVNLIPDYLDNAILRKCDKKKIGEIDLIMGSFRSTEFLTTGYRNAYFNPNQYDRHQKSFVNLSIINPIGGGDWSKNNSLKHYATLLKQNKKELVANPDSYYSLIHVLDIMMKVLDTIYTLYAPPVQNEIVDSKIIGSKLSLKDEVWITHFLKELYPDKNFTIKTEQKPVSNNPATAELSYMSDYRQINDWIPRWDAETALTKTIEWFQARERGANMQRYSLNQIDEFLNC
ncbi:MAG: NAD-dependent epimerase/dehydratase family protein [Pigmentiphaga sp.]|nr:NAD-dependent epimerase/dehydratase family protein [Pigmentiphaga sp.]